MKKIYSLIIVLISCNILLAQISIVQLNDVPDSFKKKYYSKPREYNPLQVGNVWQYYYEDYTFPFYATTKIDKDSIINNKLYYKKISYQIDDNIQSSGNISWERNDTVSGVSFMLDFQDVNENGESLEELSLDSLENPHWTRYRTYKYSYPNSNYFTPGEKEVLVKDTMWIEIEGDTVISRYFEFGALIFWAESIADKFGIWEQHSESPRRYCTGAIINGRQYGTIVNIEDIYPKIPKNIRLENNYPNPFNPTTTINYSILSNSLVKLELYDILGNKIKTLVNEYKLNGNYSYILNMNEFASGIYIYSLINKDTRINKKLIYLK